MHTTYFAHFKCTSQWFFVYSQRCAAINFRIFPSPEKKPHFHEQSLPSSPAPPLATTNPLSVSGFASSEHFREMESHSTGPFVTSFFHFAKCFPGSSMLRQESARHSFLLLSSASLNGQIQLLTDGRLRCCHGWAARRVSVQVPMGVGPPLPGTRLGVELPGWAAPLCLPPAGRLCSSGFTSHARCLLRGLWSFPACPSRPPPDQPGFAGRGARPGHGSPARTTFSDLVSDKLKVQQCPGVSRGSPCQALRVGKKMVARHGPHGY